MTPRDFLDFAIADTINKIDVFDNDLGDVIWTGTLDDFQDTDYCDRDIDSFDIGDHSLTFNISL